jgi:AraC-like DNA-binding protein
MMLLAKKNKRSFIPSLSNTISYIENNYSEDLKLKTLADMAGVSINGLINIFKNHFGVTPLSYIISLRIQKACEIMHSSEKPITEIAFEVGFTDSNYFSRAFKKNTGITPSEYRKQYLNL